MARELVKKYVDGRLYEFQQMNATMSLRTLAKMTKMVGEPIAIALGSGIAGKGKKPLAETDISPDVFGKAVRALIDRMDEGEVIALVKMLAGDGVLCDHQPIIFDDHYTGDIAHLMRVLLASLEVQYGNFFNALFAKASTPEMTGAVGVM